MSKRMKLRCLLRSTRRYTIDPVSVTYIILLGFGVFLCNLTITYYILTCRRFLLCFLSIHAQGVTVSSLIMVKGTTHADGKFDVKPYTPTSLNDQKGNIAETRSIMAECATCSHYFLHVWFVTLHYLPYFIFHILLTLHPSEFSVLGDFNHLL